LISVIYDIEGKAIEISAKSIPTKSEVQAMIDEAISAIPVYNGEVEDV
jgi:hypothetical protein